MHSRIEVIGVYRLALDDELFERAFEIKYRGLDLPQPQRRAALTALRDELSSVVRIELTVHERDARFDVGAFRQGRSEQVPYDEAYLSPDGVDVIELGAVPTTEPLRVAFFLHDFDPSRPLESSYGTIPLPSVQADPARLRALLPYEPVD